jgi:RimJ/RimL family protein N-acetyltransferase
VRENNRASLRVIEKIGMTRVERVPDGREGVAASVWYAIDAPAASAGVPGVPRKAT